MTLINHKDILEKLRSFMKDRRLDFFIASSTDEYLNEYTTLNENTRYVLTGFCGSAGDALVTPENVFLFVDGRYHLQAEKETDKNLITVVKVGMDTTCTTALFEKISELSQINPKIGLVSKKTSYTTFKKFSEVLENKKAEFWEIDYDPVLTFADIKPGRISRSLRYISTDIAGITPSEKLGLIKNQMNKTGIDILVLTKLEEIAYLTNLRGDEIPYNSTFKAKAVIKDDKAYIFTDLDKIPDSIKNRYSKDFEFKEDKTFVDFIREIKNIISCNIGFNSGSANLFTYRLLEKTEKNLIELDKSLIAEMMARKNQAEINHLQDCFRRTDIVVSRAISWLNQNLEKGNKISEKDFSDRVKSLFMEEGAYSLSFEIISASGNNTAFIHYSTPDPEKFIKIGELILLDCGGYFEGGYATDITRTFLAGGLRAEASQEAKKIYTKVLKSFLRGLNYQLREATTGFDIDKAVRETVTQGTEETFKFSHGTGHGVGISVHESPPRISPAEASKTVLDPGMVFTIEPGLYNDNWGGVRLENTVTVIKTPDGKKIQTLTRSKFDENLIDCNDLTEQEISWLKDYQKRAIG